MFGLQLFGCGEDAEPGGLAGAGGLGVQALESGTGGVKGGSGSGSGGFSRER